MPIAKTAISLDPELLARAEAIARQLGTTRSGLISRALAEFLERRRADEVTATLNAVYGADEPADRDEQSRLDAMAVLHREALGAENPW